MRRRVTIAVVVLHLFGTFLVPAAAHSCAESVDAGASQYPAWTVKACCDDSCRESTEGNPSAHVKKGIACCDRDLQTEPQRSRVLVPERRGELDGVHEATDADLDALQVTAPIVTAPPSTRTSQVPVYTPLRI